MLRKKESFILVTSFMKLISFAPGRKVAVTGPLLSKLNLTSNHLLKTY